MEVEALRELVLDRLKEAGFLMSEDGTLYPPSVDKEGLREIHRAASQLEIAARQDWLQRHLPEYLSFFANGDEIVPERVDPALVEVTTEQQHNLFRVARLLWSIPFSKGYGRRLRFLIMDRANNKLIGLLALQSPPLSFPARDRLFRYPPGRKTELINQTMDIQTLGAVPPYDRLLGGKLIALVAASNEIRQVYRHKYAGRATEMEQRILPPHLVALTTTSAFGRSSLYNRLRYYGTVIAESLGYTEGYGTFHLMELYPLFREFLENQGISTRGGFGTGPRRKWQTMVRALDRLGLPSDLLRHGVKREVFLFRLIDNLEAYMEGRDTEPVYRNLPFSELVAWWRERWLLPRAERVDGWREWRKEEIASLLLIEQDKAAT
ncbi:Druantia anti-phage system protein DruA [Thermogutta sp.]|uniref:Druantia anti-phage system protein DruA n=1 Tax=Thermogutta sp. TaxID=1962930 RepID=UPI00321F9092